MFTKFKFTCFEHNNRSMCIHSHRLLGKILCLVNCELCEISMFCVLNNWLNVHQFSKEVSKGAINLDNRELPGITLFCTLKNGAKCATIFVES